MPDFEAAKRRRIAEGGFRVFPDVAAQFALQDRLQKSAEFSLFAGREKLHPAVAQIPDGTCHVEAFGYLPDRITETDSLDVALVKDLNGCSHAIARFIRRRGTASANYGVGPGAGRSWSGSSSGGGTRRGSSEFNLNCSSEG